MKKNIAFILVMMASAIVISCTTGASTKVTSQSERVAEVDVLEVVVTDGAPSGLGYVGTVKALKSAKIAARYSGVVECINVAQGRQVSAGAVVAEISSQMLQSTRATAAATYEYSKDALDRVMKVKDAGGVTEQKIIEIRTEYDKAQALLQGADQALEDCRLKAPFLGVIGEVFVEVGETVTAEQIVATIFDISSLEIEISVPESEMASVALGEEMDVRIPALGNKLVKAKVSRRGIVASAVSHSYTCTLTPSKTVEGLLPGMVCGVKKAAENDACIVIPMSVVKTDSEGLYVWIAENGVAAKKYITTAGYAGNGVIVEEGLANGDMVITSGASKVSTGMKVRIKSE